jgi:hypothetical protein
MLSPAAIPLPRYGDRALSDLTPSCLSALGVTDFANPLGIAPAAAICLLLIDGLGWELLRAHQAEAPFLNSLARDAGPLTACFPSTTATSVAAVGTGLPPGEHGFVGYTMAMPGMTHALNCLRWQPYAPGPQPDLREALVPEQVQPLPTAFERAAAQGIAVAVVGPTIIAASGLTRAALRGGEFHRALSIGDLAARAASAITARPRSFVYAYYAELDAVGHARGVASDAWRLELAHVDRLAAAIAERLPAGGTFIVTADHGMVDLRPNELLDLDAESELAAGVRLLAGEARLRHVYTEPGAEADVLAAWQARLGDRMWLLRREQAIAAGLFGPTVTQDVAPRIGDIVAIAYGAVGIVQRSVDAGQARLVGHHGSVTAAEQLVPFLTVRH